MPRAVPSKLGRADETVKGRRTKGVRPLLLLSALAARAAADTSAPPGPTTAPPEIVVEAGVRFSLTATPLPAGPGRWSLRVDLAASSADGREHGIERDPITWSGNLDWGTGSTLGFGEGSGGTTAPAALRIRPGATLRFSRALAARETRPVDAGETLRLTVGVWRLETAGRHYAPTLFRVLLAVDAKGRPSLLIVPFAAEG
jgi:hypothetical protein